MVELVVGEDMEGAVVCGVLCLSDGHGEVVSDDCRPAAAVQLRCVQMAKLGKVCEVAPDEMRCRVHDARMSNRSGESDWHATDSNLGRGCRSVCGGGRRALTPKPSGLDQSSVLAHVRVTK